MDNKFLEGFCENIDASVWSGDALATKATRDEFKSYLDSWYRGLEEMEEVFKELEGGVDDE